MESGSAKKRLVSGRKDKMIGQGLFVALVLTMVAIVPGRGLAEDYTTKLDDIVITATRTEEKIKDVPQSTVVITREEIEKSGATQIPELLQNVPGMFVNDLDGNGLSPSLGIRGVDPGRSTRVLVMINGVPVNGGDTGSVFYRDLPALDQIEQVEVVKGPVSTLYGGFGLGGCINIITRKESREPKTRARAAVGSYGERLLGAATSGTLDNTFRYMVNYDYYAGEGYIDRSEFKTHKFMTKLGFDVSDRSDLELSVGYFDAKNEIPGRITRDQYEEDRRQARSQYGWSDLIRFYSNLTYRQDIGDDDNLRVTAYYHSYLMDYIFATGTNSSYKYEGITMGGDIQYTMPHLIGKKENTLIFGSSLRYDEAFAKSRKTKDGEAIGDPTSNRLSKPLFWAAYVQDEFKIFKPLTLTLGLRYDWAKYRLTDYVKPELTGSMTMDEVSPKVGLVYNINDKNSLYGHIAKGYAAPTSSQLFSTSGNPDLKPETSLNYEIGLRSAPVKWLDLTAAVYQMDVQDEIILGPDHYENMGKSRHRGFESSVNLRLPRGFSPFFNFTYQEAKFIDYTDKKGTYDDNYLPYAPRTMISGGLNYSHPLGIDFNITGRYVDKVYTDEDNQYEIPDYTVWSTRLGYKGTFKKIDYTVFFTIKNLFDHRYYAYGYDDEVYPALPRTFMTGLTIEF